MNKYFSTSNPFFSEKAILIYLALIKLFIHVLVNIFGSYGYFRDEFYYIACTEHIDWGYVDQPPLSIIFLWINRLLMGDSIVMLRLLPAILGSAVVFLAGMVTKELGGKRFAQIFASLCVLFSPLILGMNSYYSMNSFDIFYWSVSFYLLVLIINENKTRYWLFLGLVLGFGLLNKISVIWLIIAIILGLIFTENRKFFLDKNLWIALFIALIIFLPYALWQIKEGYPTLEFIKNATSNKYVSVSPPELLFKQSLSMNPITFPIWFAGFLYFLFSGTVRKYRILPIIYILVFLILVINKNSKDEYLGPLFSLLFILGAVVFEKYIAKPNLFFIKPVVVFFIALFGFVSSPFSINVLPVDTFIQYSKSLGITPSTPEKKELSQLPQYYADMFGWEKMVSLVAAAYNSLTPDEKLKCAIIGNNYGEAGAIDFFGKRYNLPKTICGHNNYWLWGPRNATGEVVIRLGGSIEALKESYADVIKMGTFTDEYCMPYENNLDIWICKNRRSPLKDDWNEFRHYE